MVHVATSAKNPCRIRDFKRIIFDYVKQHPLLIQTKEPYFYPIDNLSLWKFLMYMTKELPLNTLLMYQNIRGHNKSIIKTKKQKAFYK